MPDRTSEAVVVCQAEDLPPDSWRLVEIEGRSIGIFNVAGRLSAILNRCPHRGAPLCATGVVGTMLPSPPGDFVFGMEGRVLRCPWHAREFDVSTGASLLPGDGVKAVTFPVRVEGEQIVLETS